MTCQSPNQLKTPAKVSWTFKMVSQFGSLGYKIMGKTAERRSWLFTECCIQACYSESWVEGKSVEEKDAQPTDRTAALWGLSSKIDSRIWVNFTRNGLRLGLRHQEPPHRRVKEFDYSCCQRRRTWAKENTWTVAQWSKVLFSDESKFCI